MKTRGRHPFTAWGSIQNRPVVFLGDINIDELNHVYKNAAPEALKALTKIARCQNQAGLKFINADLYELKTIGRLSGSIRHFGGRAFPSSYTNANGGTDVFYIPLELCQLLTKMARKK